MLFKLFLWGVLGYIVYSWLKDRMALKEGNDDRRTIHHHHYHKESKDKNRKNDDDYVDFEEL